MNENRDKDVIFTTPPQETGPKKTEPKSAAPQGTEEKERTGAVSLREDASAPAPSRNEGVAGGTSDRASGQKGTLPQEERKVCSSNQSAEKSAHTAEAEPDLAYKNGKEVFKSGILGFFIGLAVIVPGVSGSTVAIIFRLYDKLLYALGNIVRRFRKCVRFLAPIAVGLVIGFILGFLAIQKLINISPFTVIGLFAGLMLGAFPAVYDEVRTEKKTPLRVGLFLLGLAVPVAVAVCSVFLSEGGQSLEGLNVGHYLLFLVLGYLVAITQVVPGLSATAILMAFGYFTAIMDSVHLSYWQSNPAVFGVYACLGVGFVLGLVTFSKLLTKLFARSRAAAFFVIVGLSLGSIVTMFFNPDVYAVYLRWTTDLNVLDLTLGIVLFVVGIVAAYLFVRYERSKKRAPAVPKSGRTI